MRNLSLTGVIFCILILLFMILSIKLSLGSTNYFGYDLKGFILSASNFIANNKSSVIGMAVGMLAACFLEAKSVGNQKDIITGVAFGILILLISSWFRSSLPIINQMQLYSEKELELFVNTGILCSGSSLLWLKKQYFSPLVAILIIITVMTLYL